MSAPSRQIATNVNVNVNVNANVSVNADPASIPNPVEAQKYIMGYNATTDAFKNVMSTNSVDSARALRDLRTVLCRQLLPAQDCCLLLTA